MSAFVRLLNLHFSFENLTHGLLRGITLDFHQGFTSVCGPNGVGKSTLFKLIAGHLLPDSGEVEVRGLVGEVPQSTELIPADLSEFQHSFTREAVRLKKQLAIRESWYHSFSYLSTGEKKRLQLAVAMAKCPDILLVDEPTNHLDEESRQVVLNALLDFRGAGILISHDRLLLNNLCQKTAFFHLGDLRIFEAPFDQAKMEFQKQKARSKAEKEKLSSEISRVRRSAQVQREKVEQGKRNLSKKNLHKKDKDSRARINLARLTGADFADGRKKQVLSDKSERLQGKLSQHFVPKEADVSVFFRDIPGVKRIWLPAQTVDSDFLQITHPEITLDKGDCLVLTGANGSGKSSLIRHWLSHSLAKPYGYGPQEFTGDDTSEILRELTSLRTEERGKVMQLVSCLGSDPGPLMEGSVPSPGVWQKIVIARSIVQGVPLLVLDEPTNHLDLDAIHALEKALRGYEGIVICVSHDRDFIRRVGTRELMLRKKGQVTSSEILFLERI